MVLEWKWEEVWSAWWWGRVLVLVWGLVEVVVGLVVLVVLVGKVVG